MQTAQTTAQLRAFTGLPGMSIFLQGIAFADDGNAGWFYWNPLGTEPDDNFNFIVPNGASSGEWVRVTISTASGGTIYGVNVIQYGADPTGTLDSTNAFQNAMNAATAVFVPAGTYKVSGLTMPNTKYFVMFGTGPASIIMQTGANAIKWSQSSIIYNEQTIHDLGFNGTNGSGNTIDTTGAGGLTLRSLFFNNTPTGFSSIYVNGIASTYVHDTRMIDIQIYSTLAGYAGIRFGPLSSDQTITDFIMNGNFDVDYCIAMDSGAVTLLMTGGHIYNAKINVLNMAGGNNNCLFNSVTFDNAQADTINITNCTYISFNGIYVEAIQSGYSGIVLNNTNNVTILGSQFGANVGALAAVMETGTSNFNIIREITIGTLSNYVDGPFVFVGAQSTASSVPGYAVLGVNYGFSGVTTSAQAQATTQFLGVNGGQAAADQTYYLTPYAGVLSVVNIEVTSTPASGQTFIFDVFIGVTQVGTATINNGSFSATISVNTAAASGTTVYIESIFSATSGSSFVRYSVNFFG